jgi:pimeloyl-ACP methyl ester carboxylesterase
MTLEERQQYLEKLLKILPAVPAFRQWLQKTGELPPDFDALPRHNDLPDPLRFFNGKPVTTPQEWEARRAEIKELFQKYVLGTFPPRPKIDRVVQVDEVRGEGVVTRRVRLEFGPGRRGRVSVELFIPDGKGPLPVLMGPGIRAWAQLAVRRGYLCAVYAGADSNEETDALAELYPNYDFALLPRRVWSGMMALDYVQTLPQADMKHVGFAGHSWAGKTALMGAAFDDRVTAVIASSTGVGGSLPWRLKGERGFGEGVEPATYQFPNWFNLRLRFFAGREDRLPVDGNLLVASVAPRYCLVAFGLNDWVSDAWSDEQSYHSAMKVYRWLGHPERLDFGWRYGFHSIPPVEVERYLDWFDMKFGRSDRKWASDLLYDYEFDRWKQQSGETVDVTRYPKQGLDGILVGTDGANIDSAIAWEKKVINIRRTVEQMLGVRPPEAKVVAVATPAQRSAAGPVTAAVRALRSDDLTSYVLRSGTGWAMGWKDPEAQRALVHAIPLGAGVTGDLYYPASAPPAAKLPVVIWLHGYGSAVGYQWLYRWDLNPVLGLVEGGYAVLGFDMTGFGSRIFEAKHFYDRFPHWSELGKMVADTRAAIDVLEKTDIVDAQRIYLFGYSLGGMVGVYTAALDPRVKGVVSICGFTPMRLDTADRGTGGIARYSHHHGLIPRLGFFVGKESRIPYDFHELLGAIAPHPVLVIQPQLDRDAHVEDVHKAVDEARKVHALYGAADKLTLQEPWDYNRLPEGMLRSVVGNWMAETLR